MRSSLFTRWKNDALAILKAGIRVASPEQAIRRALRRSNHIIETPAGEIRLPVRLYVYGAGKASAYMARAVERICGDCIEGGIVITKEGHGCELEKIDLYEASHPIPDERGLEASWRLIESARERNEEDVVFFLLSGGASALFEVPVEGVTLQDIQEATSLLLKSGATIHEMNAVRKHLSRVKGGQLARIFYPARVYTFIISDVVGDSLDVIGSGPTVPDHSTFHDALDVLEKYKLIHDIPSSVKTYLEAGAQGHHPETVKEGDVIWERCSSSVILNNLRALNGAEKVARFRGYRTLVLSHLIEGETHETARFLVRIAQSVARTGKPIPPPACILMGGETSLNVKGNGLGGRNQELVLYGATLLHPMDPIVIGSVGTDGTDGPTDAAGALITPFDLVRAREIHLSLHEYLVRNDSYHFHEKLGTLIKTGPTGTNVMDIMMALIPAEFSEGG